MLDIVEYKDLARDASGGSIATGAEPNLRVQQLPVVSQSSQSSAFVDGTTFVRVHSSEACRVAFGANPTADATSMRLAPNSTEFFGVRSGHKVAVIASL